MRASGSIATGKCLAQIFRVHVDDGIKVRAACRECEATACGGAEAEQGVGVVIPNGAVTAVDCAGGRLATRNGHGFLVNSAFPMREFLGYLNSYDK